MNNLAPIDQFIADVGPRVRDAVPHHIPGDWMLAAIKTAAMAKPEILACDKASILKACIDAASLGLEPNTPLQQCYLIPRRGICTLQLGYEGLIALAYRSGRITGIDFDVVRAGDDFSWEKGSDAYLKHIPLGDSTKLITHAYAIAYMVGGGLPIFVVLDRAEIERRRDLGGRPGQPNTSPAWTNDFPTMASKTAMRALAPKLPMVASIPLTGIAVAPAGGPIEVASEVADVADDAGEPPLAELPADCEPEPECETEAMMGAVDAQIADMVELKRAECEKVGLTIEQVKDFNYQRHLAYGRKHTQYKKAGKLAHLGPHPTSLSPAAVAAILNPEPPSNVVELKPKRDIPGLRDGRIVANVSKLYGGMRLEELATPQLRMFYAMIRTLCQEKPTYKPLLSCIAMEGCLRDDSSVP